MSKRNKTKFPALNPKKNLKIRQELIDYDYLGKLTNDEKEWLNKFTEEYVSGSFEKTKSGNYSNKNLHKTAKERRECYERNNKRNADTFSITKTNNMLKDNESLQSHMEDKSVRTSSLSRGYDYRIN